MTERAQTEQELWMQPYASAINQEVSKLLGALQERHANDPKEIIKNMLTVLGFIAETFSLLFPRLPTELLLYFIHNGLARAETVHPDKVSGGNAKLAKDALFPERAAAVTKQKSVTSFPDLDPHAWKTSRGLKDYN